MTVSHYTSEDAEFFQYLDKEIFVGDVLDPTNSGHMSAGYYRNMKKGERNEWVVTYDEVLIVTKGALTIRTADSVTTASPALRSERPLEEGDDFAVEAAMKGRPVEARSIGADRRNPGGEQFGARRQERIMPCASDAMELRSLGQSGTHGIFVEGRRLVPVVGTAPELHGDSHPLQAGPVEAEAERGRRRVSPPYVISAAFAGR